MALKPEAPVRHREQSFAEFPRARANWTGDELRQITLIKVGQKCPTAVPAACRAAGSSAAAGAPINEASSVQVASRA